MLDHGRIGEPTVEYTGSQNAADVLKMAAGGKLIGAGMTKLAGAPADAETLRLANAAQANGIPIRAAQISTSPLVQKIDQGASHGFPVLGLRLKTRLGRERLRKPSLARLARIPRRLRGQR